MRIILASPEAKVWSSRKHIPLGLGYLAAVLREGGHDCMIYDAAIEDYPVDYYLDRAEAAGKPYDLIGVQAGIDDDAVAALGKGEKIGVLFKERRGDHANKRHCFFILHRLPFSPW